MTSDVQALTLTYGIELRPLVTPDNSAVRIRFITCFLHVALAGAVCLSLEFYRLIRNRTKKKKKIIKK